MNQGISGISNKIGLVESKVQHEETHDRVGDVPQLILVGSA